MGGLVLSLTTMRSRHMPWERHRQVSFEVGDSRHEEESWERVLLCVRDFSAPQNWGKKRVAAKEKNIGQPLVVAHCALITCNRWGVM